MNLVEQFGDLVFDIMHRRYVLKPNEYGFGRGYPTTREQNAVAGQLRNLEGERLFPSKRSKKAFADFWDRVQADKPLPGDGEIALSTFEFHYRKKMEWLQDSDKPEEKERFVPEITSWEAQQLFSDKDLKELNFKSAELLELGLLVDCLKQRTYPKVKRIKHS